MSKLKNREFVIPRPERQASAETETAISETPTADPETNGEAFEITLGESEGRTGRRLDTLLTVAAARGQARIREGLRGRQVRLANGREPNPNSSADFVKFLLEQAADPAVKRIVFLKE